ncbi:M23 family metallopeptidase [Streptomyces rimosus]|uniref:M23 family metallopeptidase n=1 Tax=Streptomyces rimosus TaxID=1927 RepID=UPI0004C969A5|nr:M23 family metallopeptidase [Streptomyces rimosus]
MASNSPAGSVPEVPFGAAGAPSTPASHASGLRIVPQATADPGAFEVDAVGASGTADAPFGTADAPFDFFEEWNPTEESLRPVRGKHRVVGKQRGGFTRGGTVLGVGVIAAVGAGGMASAEDKPPVPVSVPDLGGFVDDLAAQLPDVESLPGIGDLISDAPGSSGAGGVPEVSAAPLTQAGLSRSEAEQGRGTGDSLRDRILQQADRQQSAAEDEARAAAEQAAGKQAAQDAAASRQAAGKAAAAKEAAEREARREAEAAARAKAEAERRAELARSYVSPLTSYTLTAGFGQAGDRWVANHTGLDFAAPTGTPVKAVHGGTITQAGWSGAYGYRIVLTTDDGTELWFCHLSSIVRASGKVAAGDVIGRVGATGNVTGPHLHLEVRPGGGAPVDPKPWLREHGLDV